DLTPDEQQQCAAMLANAEQYKAEMAAPASAHAPAPEPPPSSSTLSPAAAASRRPEQSGRPLLGNEATAPSDQRERPESGLEYPAPGPPGPPTLVRREAEATAEPKLDGAHHLYAGTIQAVRCGFHQSGGQTTFTLDLDLDLDPALPGGTLVTLHSADYLKVPFHAT